MDRNDFLREICALGLAFDKDLSKKGGLVEEYYKAIGEFSDRQVADLFNSAKRCEERFPPISRLIQLARDAGFTTGLSQRDAKISVVTVWCKCGETMGVLVRELENPRNVFRCADPACKFTYDAGLISANTRQGLAVFGGPYYRLIQEERAHGKEHHTANKGVAGGDGIRNSGGGGGDPAF